ncbi:hypothetical protein IV203_032610 [Nitzschia inconspicua]|uniref:Uncharacterized protein n=1 Tax=Nitzschia inconspicua TaxID=303405 RepID=A0A9K3KJX1_9STRA|nr:hypothetical protein IV203_032610 [Nitzschia inconspicua]
MLTDGCPQEYLPFIQNTGVGTTFPNATHSLCYFHTASCLGMGKYSSKTLDSWIPVEQHGNPLVLQAKNLHQLMQEKTLAIRGMPLPSAGDAPEALETAHEIEIHLPDQIRELQMSQQNAATLMVAHKDTFNEQTLDLLRACQKLAGNTKERQKILVNSLEQAHGLLSAVVASLPENRKRDSIIAFEKEKQRRPLKQQVLVFSIDGVFMRGNIFTVNNTKMQKEYIFFETRSMTIHVDRRAGVTVRGLPGVISIVRILRPLSE